jgi:hypothetical protein
MNQTEINCTVGGGGGTVTPRVNALRVVDQRMLSGC